MFTLPGGATSIASTWNIDGDFKEFDMWKFCATDEFGALLVHGAMCVRVRGHGLWFNFYMKLSDTAMLHAPLPV